MTDPVTTFQRYDIGERYVGDTDPHPGQRSRGHIGSCPRWEDLHLRGATTTFNEGDSVVAAVYDPLAGTWDDAGVQDLSAGRTGAPAMSWSGEIWIIGGFDRAGNSLDTVLKYDPVGDGYSDGPTLPVVRDNADAAIQSDGSTDRLYV